MLLGEYEHTIDEKNRLTLPARFRQAFAGGVVLSRGMDGCLYAYPRESWEESVQPRLDELDPLSREGRMMQRFFYSGAAEGELDRQGRVVVPASLAAHAQLARDVVLADEVRQLLAVEPGDTVVDATFGSGGHATLLAADLRGRGRLIAIDRDPSVRPYFERFRKGTGVQGRFLRGDFAVVLQQLAD